MTRYHMKHEILLGLTTTPASDWRGKVEEMKKFGIKKIALFPTFLKKEERAELYRLLEEIADLQVPHVHLRDDMEEWELELYEKWGAQVLNVHLGHLGAEAYRSRLGKIYTENHFGLMDEEKIRSCAGICLDVSHLEASRLRRRPEYAQIAALLEVFPVGCCHVSAVDDNIFNPLNYIFGFDKHFCTAPEKMDYVGQYRRYLPKYVSLELENSFQEQAELKGYLEKIINI